MCSTECLLVFTAVTVTIIAVNELFGVRWELIVLLLMVTMMMLFDSEEDIVTQYRALTGVSRGSAIIKSVFASFMSNTCSL